jgi:hypothetical protein
MSKRKKKNLGGCAYCPEPATTEDHVPPKGMFAKCMPSKPWVPACQSCNKDASKDDEYMQRLSMLWGADACADAVEVGEKFIRSLEYPEAKGLQAEVRRSLSPLEDESLFPGGINIALQGERLGRVTDKIVRGWWFKLTGTRLPEGHRIMKFIPSKKEDRNPLYEINEAIIRRCPGHFFGDYAFSFQLAFCPHSRLTCWLFRFYKVFEIMAYTCKIEESGDFQILDLRASFCTIDDLGSDELE